MVSQWVTINSVNKEMYMPLIDASFCLVNGVCILLHMDMEYVLKVWEEEEFMPEKAAERIIQERFERVEEQ